MISEENRTGLNLQTQWWMTVKSETMFLVNRRELHLSSSLWTKNPAPRAWEGIIPKTTAICWRDLEKKYYFGRFAGKPFKRLLERGWRPKPVWTLDWFHAVHSRRTFATPSMRNSDIGQLWITTSLVAPRTRSCQRHQQSFSSEEPLPSATQLEAWPILSARRWGSIQCRIPSHRIRRSRIHKNSF